MSIYSALHNFYRDAKNAQESFEEGIRIAPAVTQGDTELTYVYIKTEIDILNIAMDLHLDTLHRELFDD